MITNILKNKISLTVLISLILFLIGSSVLAQTKPEILITWRTNSFVPSNYQGKSLPISGSPIFLSLNLINNGKIIDLSRNNVQWLVNGKIAGSGNGLRNLNITARNEDVGFIVSVDYASRKIQKFFSIPVSQPNVKIESISPEIFKARPFFFNVTNINGLLFDWKINNQNPLGAAERPDVLKILDLAPGQTMPAGFKINAEVTVSNLLNPLENAIGRLTIKN